ncbi:hypothetical protein E6A70_13050 [Staphylococcus pseudintermedius]|nr:hypothetical protein [Staphylococcus pseudintermedius]
MTIVSSNAFSNVVKWIYDLHSTTKSERCYFFEKCIERCLFTETEIYEKLVFQYAKHFLIYSKSSSEDAINKMKKIIEVMRLVESHHIASYYENHLNHILCEKNVHIWDSL